MITATETLHATCVAIDGTGVLIIGPSGAGKSSLALHLIALGAVLVSDDQTTLTKDSGTLIATAPKAIKGLIESRGLGILPVPVLDSAPLRFVVDMSQTEAKRLPEPHHHTVLDTTLPCLHKVDSPHFPSALLLYIRQHG